MTKDTTSQLVPLPTEEKTKKKPPGRLRRLISWLSGRGKQAESKAGGPESVGLAPTLSIKQVVRSFWPYLRPYRHWLWLAILFAGLSPAVDTATIWLFKVAVDQVLVPHNLSVFPMIVGGYLGLSLLGGLISFLDSYASTWVGESFLFDLRNALFKHLTLLSPLFYQKRPLGDLVSRLTDDIDSIESLLISSAASMVSYVAQLIFFCAALFYLRWDLALVALVVSPLFWLSGSWFSRRIKRISREKRRQSGSISAVAQESLNNLPLVQAYGREKREVDRFTLAGRRFFLAQMASTRLSALFTPVVDLIEMGGVLVIIGGGTWELATGRLTLGGLLVFVAYLSQLYTPIRGMASLATSLYSGSASAERILELLHSKPEVVDGPDLVPAHRISGEIELAAVSYRYPDAPQDTLHEVNLSVAPGEVVAVAGPNGAGKSTLIRLLLRFDDPSGGAILLGGHDLRQLSLATLRTNLAVVLQETLVFNGTIRENILFGHPDAQRREVRAAARMADAAEFIEALPEGYDTVVGEQGRRLSGGQRQRLAIARAFIRDAPILILDEPTISLDGRSEERVIEPLRRLMEGRTTLVVSHSLFTVREATRVVLLDAGRVVDQGTHPELLQRSPLYASLYPEFEPQEVKAKAV
ncbi:MAG: ABC transporter ATP-binding protein [Candidatus Dormibacteraceae bacterium]